MKENPNIVKIALIGDSGVGKTALLECIKNAPFPKVYAPTMGVDFAKKSVDIDGKEIMLHFWDIGENLSINYSTCYSNTDLFLVCCDLTNRVSFENMSKHLDNIKSFGKTDPQILIVGNKADLKDSRKVDEEALKNFSNKNGHSCLILSAKETCEQPNNIFFERLVNTIEQNILQKNRAQNPVAQTSDQTIAELDPMDQMDAAINRYNNRYNMPDFITALRGLHADIKEYSTKNGMNTKTIATATVNMLQKLEPVLNEENVSPEKLKEIFSEYKSACKQSNLFGKIAAVLGMVILTGVLTALGVGIGLLIVMGGPLFITVMAGVTAAAGTTFPACVGLGFFDKDKNTTTEAINSVVQTGKDMALAK